MRIEDELRLNHWRLASDEAKSRRAKERATARLTLSCAWKACGAEFERLRSHVHMDPKDATCSRSCAAKYRRARDGHRKPFRIVEVPYVAPRESGPLAFTHYADYDDVPVGVGTMGASA